MKVKTSTVIITNIIVMKLHRTNKEKTNKNKQNVTYIIDTILQCTYNH